VLLTTNENFNFLINDSTMEQIKAAVNNIDPSFIINSINQFFTVFNVTELVGNTTYFFFLVLMVPLIAVYALYEYEKIGSLIKFLFPPSFRPHYQIISHDINRKLYIYIIGLGKIMLMTFAATYLILIGLGMPYAFELAIINGFLTCIPFIGQLIALIFAGAVALTISFETFIFVLIAYIIIQQIIITFLLPKIMSNDIKLSIFAIVSFGLVLGIMFGIIGLIFATPILIILASAFSYAKQNHS